MSSSPLLSPSELFNKRRPVVLRTESNAAPIPENAFPSFTTASSLFRKASLDKDQGIDQSHSFRSAVDIYDVPDEEPPEPTKKPRKTATKKDVEGKVAKVRKIVKEANTKKSRKSRGKNEENGVEGIEGKEKIVRKPKIKEDAGPDDAVKEKVPRKPRAKKAQDTTEESGIKEKAVRKPRAKKDVRTQPKLRPAQVTKSNMDVTEEASISKHFATIESIVSVQEPMDYGLVEAMKRRTDWTPPRPTPEAIIQMPLDTPAPMGKLGDIFNSGGSAKANGFINLLGNYGFSNANFPVVERNVTDGVTIKKRKLIELMKTNVSTSTSPSKAKPAKKKTRTLTDMATSAYEEPVGQPAPILQYFSVKTTERVTKDAFKVPEKPRSKSPVKRPRKGADKAPNLLSPESALKQVSNQDFVFGTSSQLAREDSPSLLRELHAAMQASNKADDDDFLASSPVAPISTVAKRVSQVKRDLWSAASRDSAGDLLNVEIVDMVNSPEMQKPSKPHLQVSMSPSNRADEIEEWHDIDEMYMIPVPLKLNSQVARPADTSIREEPLGSAPVKSTKTAKSSTQPNSLLKRNKSTSRPSSQIPLSQGSSQMPNFEVYTDAQLARQVASYHFKPIKRRAQMITLLENCWKSKQGVALDDLGSNGTINAPQKKSSQVTKDKAPSSSHIGSPNRPRGPPRKDSTTTSPAKAKPKSTSKGTSTVKYLEMDSDTPLSQVQTSRKWKSKMQAEEISDSESAPLPSPPRQSKIRTPLHLKSFIATIDSPTLSPTSAQLHLFKRITQAITSVPPSKDPQNPTWHEKILLYDPLILEDLTVWLNTGALEKVGWDGEVEPKEVKKWCESKSICCLWKENLRGGARSRY